MVAALFVIGTVERDTGVDRDMLWIWERRYGFPTPERNEKGERVYTAEQIRRLQRIRRVLDQGMRPGNVVPLDDEAIGELWAGESRLPNRGLLPPLQQWDALEVPARGT